MVKAAQVSTVASLYVLRNRTAEPLVVFAGEAHGKQEKPKPRKSEEELLVVGERVASLACAADALEVLWWQVRPNVRHCVRME